jgi:methyl-accepting chemotaxis protein
MRTEIFGKFRWSKRVHIGLRTQILLLGIAGVIVIGAIYLAGLRIEANGRQIADRFGKLESLSARLSESMLQGREIATQFLKKPNEKKVAAHEETMRAVISELDGIESIAGTLPEQDPLRQALRFRAMINSYTTRFSNVVSAQKVVGYTENDGLQGKLRAAVHSVEGKLNTFDQPRLSVLMLMMRRHEKDFMLRGDEKYGDQLTDGASEFLTELKKAELPADARQRSSSLSIPTKPASSHSWPVKARWWTKPMISLKSTIG